MRSKKVISKEIEFAGKKLSLEFGDLAMMTNMSVKASFGDTIVLVTVVSGGFNPDIDYFPLSVNYREKFYASGSVKSSRFQKREGRPTDEAIIAGRLIDHAIRPLFPNDFMDDIQVIATVLSLDEDSDPKFLSSLATSAALTASDVPWEGPMATLRVGYVNGEYVLCPSRDQLHEESELDMIVSFVGEDKRFLAVEVEANNLPEEKILGAVEFARNSSDQLLNLINDFADEINPKREKYEYQSTKPSEELLSDVSTIAKDKIDQLMDREMDKSDLSEQLEELTEKVLTDLEGKYKKTEMIDTISLLKKKAMRNLILDKGKRIDGRGLKEIRPLSCEVGVLPRTHGSALFQRGETQVLTACTLASPAQELLIQDMWGERSKKFLHYYNFPPYSSGETGRIGWPKNREIGHGMIGENALRPVIPLQNEFPYMILLVSETLSSSGSTSMAATCGSTLALMDAGVPIEDMVGGIGVGLIADDTFDKKLILTDLAYLEDAFGLLDFKMTGTKDGVTAIQADMKVNGIPFDLLPKIVEQSKEGRMEVLKVMQETISQPRDHVSQYAPKTVSLKIDEEKIGIVIGAGGKTIREIQEKTGTEISIDDDGTVVVSSINLDDSKKAAEIISNLIKDIEPGEVYEGVVEELADFGAFVEILPGKTGLLHISEISNDYVTNIEDYLKVGDKVKVKVLEAGRDGKISLSKKILEGGSQERDQRRSGGSRNDNRNNRRHDRRDKRPNNRRN